MLFHPSAPRREVKGEHLRRPGEDGEAITYFTKILPRIKEDELAKPGGPTLGMREVIQYPGDTIFVPGQATRIFFTCGSDSARLDPLLLRGRSASSPALLLLMTHTRFAVSFFVMFSRRLVARRAQPRGLHGRHAELQLARQLRGGVEKDARGQKGACLLAITLTLRMRASLIQAWRVHAVGAESLAQR